MDKIELLKDLGDWGKDITHALVGLGFDYHSTQKDYELKVYENPKYLVFIPYGLSHTEFDSKEDFYVRFQHKNGGGAAQRAGTIEEIKKILLSAPKSHTMKTNKSNL